MMQTSTSIGLMVVICISRTLGQSVTALDSDFGVTSFDGTIATFSEEYYHSSGATVICFENTYYFSNGQVSERIGNLVIDSDGTYRELFGNYWIDSDGSYTELIGNTYFHSDDKKYIVTKDGTLLDFATSIENNKE